MKILEVWWRMTLLLKTPLLLFLDLSYQYIPESKILEYFNLMPKLPYIPDKRDCDNYAFMFKGVADADSNATGVVIGWATWAKSFHAWNVALTDKGVIQIEPQTGEVFRTKKGYIPMVVII